MEGTQQRCTPSRNERRPSIFQPWIRRVFYNPRMDVSNTAGKIEAMHPHITGLQSCFNSVGANFVDILNTGNCIRSISSQGCSVRLLDECITLLFRSEERRV